MQYKFNFCPYKREFIRPLQTNHGIWDIREGIIIHLVSETGNIGSGEIAPIPWFASETIEQALAFCQQLPLQVSEEFIFSIPDKLSACQFGFESAWEMANLALEMEHKSNSNSFKFSALLPAGFVVLDAWKPLWNQGYRTFKWKISVHPIVEEIAIFKLLVKALPEGTKLRLDANGGLNYETANLWLFNCDRMMSKNNSLDIEFIEQPLPASQFAEMLELGNCYSTKIALDESVSTLHNLETCYQDGWQGVFVIKPGIIGSLSRLRNFCHRYQIDAVFSSVFETDVGRNAALRLADELSLHKRAVGFGVNHWFQEEEI
ncbi:o-succinylbenzoate synthase [Brunnivagina elsteri]|uniref:o-succinylbenzoate synthase n=1 Tax=Brunnivagina elsteri CCALA 953 TaxID=987040 RepID=A0A2A2TPB3_9CYAN|nr:o-succinylbenzoate synthase [Calothrix elsteri]PAX60272.1 o-succinylbenzoate synthase [Calothrix elsteri CCALA 953]